MVQGREYSEVPQEEMLSSSFYLFYHKSSASRNLLQKPFSPLDQFITRRGIPAEVFSDNGSNFIGAQAELKKIYQLPQDQ